jgi:sugar O-acyltransferase (sialic acid O-acetyltransferase NeuD family)
MEFQKPSPLTAPLVIYGAGGHGKVLADIALRCGIEIALLLDDDVSVKEICGLPVQNARTADWSGLAQFVFHVAIGDNVCRERIFNQLLKRGGMPWSLIHPFTAISPGAEVGRGVAVCAGAVINPGARIADDCIINTCASVDHDCIVQAHAHVCPGVRLAGNVQIGARTMVGVGASILPGVRIGEGCRIGAGAVVNRDVPDNVVAFGVPARVRWELPKQG